MAEINEFTSSSRNINTVRHDGETDTLTVTFQNGRTYEYSGVSRELFETLHDVEQCGGSVGSTFSTLIRNGGFEYREVTG